MNNIASLPVSAVFEIYLKSRYTLAPKTKQIYTDAITHLLERAGDCPLEEMTSGKLNDYFKELRESGRYSQNYQNQKWRVINTFFNFCVVKQEWLVRNPMVSVDKPRQQLRIAPKLTMTQIKEVIRAVEQVDTRRFDLRSRNKAIVLLMLDSGLRVGEVARLRINDVDFDAGELTVFSDKTDKERIVPMGAETAQAIKDYLADDNRSHLQTGQLFLTSEGNPVKPRTIALLVGRLKKGPALTAYTHTFSGIHLPGITSTWAS